jgi:hypothetical protein
MIKINPTPDQGLNQGISDHPNKVRRSHSLSLLSKAGGRINPKSVNPIPADLLAAAEEQLTAAQKDKIKRRYKKVANANDSERSSSRTDVEASGKTSSADLWK